jgi:ABC-2 type transport system ATP-binding protein
MRDVESLDLPMFASSLRVDRGDFILDIAEFGLAFGSRVGLIGANGAGKTSLLETLAGRLTPTRGTIRVLGVPIRDWGYEVGLSVGLVRDHLEGIPTMTVREHFALRRRLFPGWQDEHASWLQGQLEIPQDKRLDELSKGGRAKVEFVSVEAYRPPILLLDEPTGGLDPGIRKVFHAALMESLSSGRPRALLFSTHLTEDLEEIADRVVVVAGGRLVSDCDIPEGAAPAARRAVIAESVALI